MNRICLVGNLTMDPELRQTNSGISVCTFSVAVNRRFSNQQGEREADFIPVVTWRVLADNCSKYLAKGRKVAVIGSLQTRKYEDKQGNKRTAFEVVADDVEFLSPRNDGAAFGAPQQSGYGAPQQAQPAAPRYQANAPAFEDVSGFAEMDDTQLPF